MRRRHRAQRVCERGEPSVFELINPWRDYAWGSLRALPDFMDRPRTGEPVAEVWMGTHHVAPSHVQTTEGPLALSKVSGDLPFMVKLLAADRPLSIQVHPTRHRAEQGFEAEEAAGIPATDALRTYRDRRAKPEMVYALSTFDTLVGFRPTAEILRLLAPIETALSRDLGERLSADPGFAGIVKLVDYLLTDPGVTNADIEALHTRCRELVSVDLDIKRAYATVLDVAQHHPGDPGIAVTLLMNRLTLQPGEAAFLSPGIIHSHLSGMCVEIMECSDNVVRAGLTSKHVDVAELVHTLEEGMARLARVTPVAGGPNTDVFTVDSGAFALAVTQSAASATPEPELGPVTDRIVTCLGGHAIIIDAAGEKVELSRGASLYASAGDGLLTLGGTCEVAVAYQPVTPGSDDRMVDLV